MKKNRNAFFQETSSMYQGMDPNMMNGPMPFNASTNYNAYYSNNANTFNDYDSRLSKIERQINRLEHRINKLESVNTNTFINDATNNDMYML